MSALRSNYCDERIASAATASDDRDRAERAAAGLPAGRLRRGSGPRGQKSWAGRASCSELASDQIRARRREVARWPRILPAAYQARRGRYGQPGYRRHLGSAGRGRPAVHPIREYGPDRHPQPPTDPVPHGAADDRRPEGGPGLLQGKPPTRARNKEPKPLSLSALRLLAYGQCLVPACGVTGRS
jgi:hypothetical protein